MIKEQRILKQTQGIKCNSNPIVVGNTEIEYYQQKIDSNWQIIDGRYLKRTFKTKDFTDSLLLINKIGYMAEEINHHPVITLTMGEVAVTLYTPEIDGLSDFDFQLASKIDVIYF